MSYIAVVARVSLNLFPIPGPASFLTLLLAAAKPPLYFIQPTPVPLPLLLIITVFLLLWALPRKAPLRALLVLFAVTAPTGAFLSTFTGFPGLKRKKPPWIKKAKTIQKTH